MFSNGRQREYPGKQAKVKIQGNQNSGKQEQRENHSKAAHMVNRRSHAGVKGRLNLNTQDRGDNETQVKHIRVGTGNHTGGKI